MTTMIGAFAKATTLVDGGWRISFDLDETEAKNVAELTKLRGRQLFVCVITKAEQKRREKSGGK